MKFIISDKSGESVVIETDGTSAKIIGSGYIYDIAKSILDKKELKYEGERVHFPRQLLRKNDKGVTEINTASTEYLKSYLPKFVKAFGLDVEVVS